MGKLNSFSFFSLMLAGDTNRLITGLSNEKKGLPRSVTPREKLISFSLSISNGAASRQRKSSLAGTKGPSSPPNAVGNLISFFILSSVIRLP
jgi:hypothetical protein